MYGRTSFHRGSSFSSGCWAQGCVSAQGHAHRDGYLALRRTGASLALHWAASHKCTPETTGAVRDLTRGAAITAQRVASAKPRRNNGASRDQHDRRLATSPTPPIRVAGAAEHSGGAATAAWRRLRQNRARGAGPRQPRGLRHGRRYICAGLFLLPACRRKGARLSNEDERAPVETWLAFDCARDGRVLVATARGLNVLVRRP